MGDFECPVEDCKDCEFNRIQSWCARALPDHKGDTELQKIRMEGFWEAIDWCEEHYKWMEELLEECAAENDRLEKEIKELVRLLEECYTDGRAPTEADMFVVDSFWNED